MRLVVRRSIWPRRDGSLVRCGIPDLFCQLGDRKVACGNLDRAEYQTKFVNALLGELLKRKQPATSS